MAIITTPHDDFFINESIKREMDGAIALNKKDNDCIIIIDGREGSGKSVLALQLAFYCDRRFTEDGIVFSIEDFAKKIRELPYYSSLVFDEAFRGFSSRSVLSQENKKLVRLLMECRQRRLFIFLVLPSFFELETYASIHRSQYLFHVYMRRHTRGFWVGFGYKQKERLFHWGKKGRSYSRPRTGFIGNFKNAYPINEDAYRRKKEASFRRSIDESEELNRNDMKKFALGEILTAIKKNGSFNQKQLADLVGLSVQQVRHRLDFYRKLNEDKELEQDEANQSSFHHGTKEFVMPQPNQPKQEDEK